MKEGVFDVIPAGSVDTLTAEDFRLLLNGVGDINVTTLISYTSFNDESGKTNIHTGWSEIAESYESPLLVIRCSPIPLSKDFCLLYGISLILLAMILS